MRRPFLKNVCIKHDDHLIAIQVKPYVRIRFLLLCISV